MADCSVCPLFLLFRCVFSGDKFPLADRIITVIMELTANQFDVSVSDLVSVSRKPKIIRARKSAMKRCREFDIPFTIIGHAFTRSHSTVIESIK